MGIDPWGDLQDIQEQHAENELDSAPMSVAEGEIMQVPNSDVAVMAADSSAQAWLMTTTEPVYWGWSTSYRRSYQFNNSRFSSIVQGQPRTWGTYNKTGQTEIYYEAVAEYTLDIWTSKSLQFDGDSPLIFEGVLSAFWIVTDGTDLITAAPTKVDLLINGVAQGKAFSYGQKAKWEVSPSDTLSEITSYGYRLTFPKYAKSQSVSSHSETDLQWFMDDTAITLGSPDPTLGLLGNIIALIRDVISAIVRLPGNIASAILDGLQGLFVPSQEDFTNLKVQYETLLEERLGFIWQAGEWVVTFGQSILTAVQSGNEYSFTFPGISFPMGDTTYVLAEPTEVSLENGFLEVVRPVLGTIVAIICVIAFVNTAEDMVAAVVSGATYFEYLKGRREDDN